MATTSDRLPPLSDEAATILFKEKKADDVDPFEQVDENGSIRYFKTVFFGDPGAGKTSLASLCGLPNESYYWIDCEDARRVLVGKDYLRGRLQIGKFYGFIETTYVIEKIIREGKYKVVVLDSFTSAKGAEMLDILKNSGFTRSKTPGGQQSYTEQDYGLFLNRLSWFLDYVVKAPINVIINAHVKEPSELEIINGQMKTLIGSANQVAELGSKMGNVFYVEDVLKDSVRRRVITTRNDGKVKAKCTIDELPDQLTLEKFVDAIHKWRRGEPI